MGGLGLRSVSLHSYASYLSSLVKTRSAVEEVLSAFEVSSDYSIRESLDLFLKLMTSVPQATLDDLSNLQKGDFSQKNLSELH